MHEEVVVVVAAVLVGGVAAQWLGWRFRVPAVLPLLLGGLVSGPVTGALDPDDVFGELLFPGVTVAVGVILFEGAMSLGGRGVRTAGRTALVLLTVGAAFTLVTTTLLARVVLDVEWELAALLASILVVTGPTVIGPVVRALGLHGRVAAILESEGTLLDPVGAILAVLTFEAAFASEGNVGDVAEGLLVTMAVGMAIGAAAAGLLVLAFARYLVPDELHNVTTLAVVISALAAGNALSDEAGLVAVTVMGVILSTQSRVAVDHVLRFNETLRILFISGLFILLGARIESSTLSEIEWRNIAFLCLLVVVVRPMAVAISTVRSGLTFRERLFLALTAPRGIVAAAVASVFSLQLLEVGAEGSQVVVSVVFTVILGTVLLSGLGARPLATRLGLVDSGARAFVILGVNPVAREIGRALEQQDAPVHLIGLDRQELARARMTGLRTKRGSVVAEETWAEAGIANAGCFLALTDSDELNLLAAREAANVLGQRDVYQLSPVRPEHGSYRTRRNGSFARTLFDPSATIDVLSERIDEGWRIRATPLTEQFGPDDLARRRPGAIPMFLVNRHGQIDPVAVDLRRKPRAGDTLLSLAPPEPDA